MRPLDWQTGARVAPDPPDSIRELVTPIRETLEVFALRLFVSDLREEDFAAWEEILSRMKAACEKRDYAAIAEQDMALHRSLLQRAGQEDLLAIWSVLVARVRSHFRANNPRYADPLEIYAEHRELIDTFRRGDAEASVKALREHITSAAPLRSKRSRKRDGNR
jgi:DNA-binding GntR family transcriptional regulator